MRRPQATSTWTCRRVACRAGPEEALPIQNLWQGSQQPLQAHPLHPHTHTQATHTTLSTPPAGLTPGGPQEPL